MRFTCVRDFETAPNVHISMQSTTTANKTGKCTYNVTLRKVHANIVAVEKRKVLRILSVCLWPYLSRMQSACAILYCYLLPLFL